MWWRQRTGDGEKNKANMHRLVASGIRPGLLAYQNGSPVGWVSIAPRETMGQLMRSGRYRPTDDDRGVYVIACFYVHAAAKRQGVATELLDAALNHARERAAYAVDAYPNERPDYMGNREDFEERGFRPVRDAGKRTVMRISLARPSTAADRIRSR
jgi:GNAT superfamily N-acetyltransferase